MGLCLRASGFVQCGYQTVATQADQAATAVEPKISGRRAIEPARKAAFATMPSVMQGGQPAPTMISAQHDREPTVGLVKAGHTGWVATHALARKRAEPSGVVISNAEICVLSRSWTAALDCRYPRLPAACNRVSSHSCLLGE